MQIKLVFMDWRGGEGQSLSFNDKFELMSGHFHSGTEFDGDIELHESDADELRTAIESGYQPVFVVLLRGKDG